MKKCGREDNSTGSLNYVRICYHNFTGTMTDKRNQCIYIEPNWGLFVGRFTDNVTHKHYAIQLTVSSDAELMITDQYDQRRSFDSCFIDSNIPHQLMSTQVVLIILINPTSTLGLQVKANYGPRNIMALNKDLKPLSRAFSEYLCNDETFSDFTIKISTILMNVTGGRVLKNHTDDDRIYSAVLYLEQHFNRVVSLKEIAYHCFLSETRFLHLFKEKTNLNFRRYQIWNKLVMSLPFLHRQSITQTAHQFGFTDSSHYNRCFKQTFGLSPKFLSKLK